MTETTLPAAFRRIRLELAREPGHPSGDARTGYLLVAPLDRRDRIDDDLWRANKDACQVIRFRDGEKDADGRLVLRRGGVWAFNYETEAGEDDDPGFRLGQHRFAQGEYVTIEEDEGAHTYRVVTVQPL